MVFVLLVGAVFLSACTQEAVGGRTAKVSQGEDFGDGERQTDAEITCKCSGDSECQGSLYSAGPVIQADCSCCSSTGSME